MNSIKKTSRIYVAGHEGLVGSALMQALKAKGYVNIITVPFSQLDLRDQQAVNNFFATEKPEYVFLAAARVGGIKANAQYPATFMYDNLLIATHTIHAAYTYSVKKLLFLGSSCIYPRICLQPIKEDYLLTGSLEKTNEAYALAKIAGLMLCKAYNQQYGTTFISCMPTNLYGPGDTFDPDYSHVIPSLIKKFHDAKVTQQQSVTLWGSGKARREFLFVDDLARALLLLMDFYDDSEPINIGVGSDSTIAELALLIKQIICFEGDIVFLQDAFDGTPQKLLDSSRITKLGWFAQTSLREGLKKTYAWYLEHCANMQQSKVDQRLSYTRC